MTKAFSCRYTLTLTQWHALILIRLRKTLSKHILYAPRKTNPRTERKRVSVWIWWSLAVIPSLWACSFYIYKHISSVWFGISCVSSSFQIHQQIEITGNVCDNVNGIHQQWQSRKNITNELERIVNNAHIVSFICYKFEAFLLQQRNPC